MTDQPKPVTPETYVPIVHEEIKGDLEKLMDIVISHYPIALYDYNKEKTAKKYDTEEMYKKILREIY